MGVVGVVDVRAHDNAVSVPVPVSVPAGMHAPSASIDEVAGRGEQRNQDAQLGSDGPATSPATSMEEDDACIGKEPLTLNKKQTAFSSAAPPAAAAFHSRASSPPPAVSSDADVSVSQVMPGFDVAVVMPAHTSKLTGQATATIRPMVFSKDMFHRIEFVAQCDNKVPPARPPP